MTMFSLFVITELNKTKVNEKFMYHVNMIGMCNCQFFLELLTSDALNDCAQLQLYQTFLIFFRYSVFAFHK